MTRPLPTEGVRPDEDDATGDIVGYLQFRGRQTVAIIDDYGIVFDMSHSDVLDQLVHNPLPVVRDDADDPPADAVAASVAEDLADSNPVIEWGVVCEHADDDGICGEVFASPESLRGHISGKHHTSSGSADDTESSSTDEDTTEE